MMVYAMMHVLTLLSSSSWQVDNSICGLLALGALSTTLCSHSRPGRYFQNLEIPDYLLKE